MLIPFQEKQKPFKRLFNHYTENLKVGQVLSITGGSAQKTGVGKSYAALRIGEECDSDFGIDRVTYTPYEFLKEMQVIEESKKSSGVIILDESEIAIGSHAWNTLLNRTVAHTIATNRYLRCISIFVCPTFNSLDVRVRRLTNWVAFMDRFYKRFDDPTKHNSSKVRMRLYQIKTDLSGDLMFYKRPQMFNSDKKKVTTFKSFDVSLPSEKLCEEYEKKALEFKSKFRVNLMKEAEKFEKKQFDKNPEKEKQLRLEDLVSQALKNKVISEALLNDGKITKYTVKSELEAAGVELTHFEAGAVRKVLEVEGSGRS